MCDYWKALVTEPEALADLSILSKQQQEHLLIDLNQSAPLELPRSSIHEVFEVQAEANPDAIALVHADQTLSYQELNQRANQLSHHLLAQGVQVGELVGVYLPRSIDFFVSLLGILKSVQPTWC